ncbi:hypothetical protein DTQ13_01225 [Parasaccharibacter sp. TMW 2.1888]|uniref:Uncharacterized protein n=2 Tax=Acetobacterales TaxID=3120395 RepID=A0ABR9MPS1_9PROT|nr:hypothetical protein [Bombella apis]MBR9729961.1 hypothetical protein [Bombella apis]MCL1515165.1 hypothetical protein [Parasaccharibacter sp. TMW2.1890]MPV99008.1 hypothetical protein [Bombella apis]UPO80457.1 hypothetical protein DTQ13_01225 [Parasaccharibacter sp. TMW 2.1888]
MVRRKRPIFYTASRKEVSVLSTLGRMVVLLGLTCGLLLVVRFYQPATRLMQHAVSTALWQRLYGLFHVETALGREQLILIGIVLSCFLLALLIQLLALWLMNRVRRR